MIPLEELCCINNECPDYGKKGEGNLVVRKIYGKHELIQYLRCSTCKAEFSERKGTPLYRSRLAKEKALSILKHIAEGDGLRKTHRLLGVSKDTVGRLMHLVGKHAEKFHHQKVRDVEVKEVQFDEKWSFVGKKREEL